MAAADGEVLPIVLVVSSATPDEARLIEQTLDTSRISRKGAGRPRKNQAIGIWAEPPLVKLFKSVLKGNAVQI